MRVGLWFGLNIQSSTVSNLVILPVRDLLPLTAGPVGLHLWYLGAVGLALRSSFAG